MSLGKLPYKSKNTLTAVAIHCSTRSNVCSSFGEAQKGDETIVYYTSNTSTDVDKPHKPTDKNRLWSEFFGDYEITRTEDQLLETFRKITKDKGLLREKLFSLTLL